MRHTSLLSPGLALGLMLTAGAARSATFEKARIVPEMGLDALTRSVSRQQVGRDLFSDPWSTVTIGHVDVYNVFPYVESRTFQVISDPHWNRLVFGEQGRTLRAYDGSGLALGALREPRGLAVDEIDRVYVADAGHDRIVVLQAATRYGEIELTPVFEIPGLAHPNDVAWSDGGTPFVQGDDMLYVADTGRNRIVAYALGAASAREVATLGTLGSGPGCFAGPMAIRAGRSNGANTPDVFVADAHTRRIVHLQCERGSFRWISDVPAGADVVTSLDTDQWGNVYAAAPNEGVIRKFSPDLVPVAELRGDLARPRSFHIPFFTVRDHRDGTVTRQGRPDGLSVEQWSDASGVRLWSFGLEIPDLAVTGGSDPVAHFTLTDRAAVTLEFADPSTGRAFAQRTVGTLDAGVHEFALTAADLAAASGRGDLVLRIAATSSYANGPSAKAEAGLRVDGAGVAPPAHSMLLGSAPNPARSASRIVFMLPVGDHRDVSLRLFDSQGRLVRSFDAPFAAGRNEVTWDLRDAAGRTAAAGVYFCRLHAADKDLSQRLVVVP